MRIPFDTHAFVKKLTAAGLPEAQAEVHAEALGDLVIERLATREDIANLREDLRAFATKDDLKDLKGELKGELKDLELRLTLRFGGMAAAAVAITAAVVKFL